jgi:hypothetical protein
MASAAATIQGWAITLGMAIWDDYSGLKSRLLEECRPFGPATRLHLLV